MREVAAARGRLPQERKLRVAARRLRGGARTWEWFCEKTFFSRRRHVPSISGTIMQVSVIWLSQLVFAGKCVATMLRATRPVARRRGRG